MVVVLEILLKLLKQKKFAYDNDPKIKKISNKLFNPNYIDFISQKKLKSIKKIRLCFIY